MIHISPRTDIELPEVDAGAIVVRHKAYEAPRTGPGARHVIWEDFLEAPRAWISGSSTMVVVGLNRILTPSNRTKLGPYLLRPTAGLRRISVDRTLFTVEPWRAWWHFGCVGAPFQDYTYSFLAESHWRAAQDGARPDPFTLETIIDAGHGVIVAHGDPWFSPLEVHRVVMPEEIHEAYQQEKAQAFEEEHTPKAIIRRLADFAQVAMPERSILTPSRLFSTRKPVVMQTDLGVDDWLVGQLRGLVDLSNGIIKGCAR